MDIAPRPAPAPVPLARLVPHLPPRRQAPLSVHAHYAALAQAYIPEILEFLAEQVRDTELAPAERRAAASMLLERGLGRPVAPVVAEHRHTFEQSVLAAAVDGER